MHRATSAIPAPVGFNPHSDGDVLCHALIDAMAGAGVFRDAVRSTKNKVV